MKRRIGVVLVLALALSLGMLTVASAHAKLVSSDPAAGAKLDKAPSKVTLVFSEEISDKSDESNVTVTDEQGSEVGKGGLDTTDLDHKTQTATLNAGLGDGIYTVKWNALTPDDQGHSGGEAEEATPTATAAGGAAQPTATPAGAAKPGTLPKTGESGPDMSGYLLLGAAILLAGGVALRRGRAHTRR